MSYRTYLYKKIELYLNTGYYDEWKTYFQPRNLILSHKQQKKKREISGKTPICAGSIFLLANSNLIL